MTGPSVRIEAAVEIFITPIQQTTMELVCRFKHKVSDSNSKVNVSFRSGNGGGRENESDGAIASLSL